VVATREVDVEGETPDPRPKRGETRTPQQPERSRTIGQTSVGRTDLVSGQVLQVTGVGILDGARPRPAEDVEGIDDGLPVALVEEFERQSAS